MIKIFDGMRGMRGVENFAIISIWHSFGLRVLMNTHENMSEDYLYKELRDFLVKVGVTEKCIDHMIGKSPFIFLYIPLCKIKSNINICIYNFRFSRYSILSASITVAKCSLFVCAVK